MLRSALNKKAIVLAVPGFGVALFCIAIGIAWGLGFSIGQIGSLFRASVIGATGGALVFLTVRSPCSIKALVIPMVLALMVTSPWIIHGISTFPGTWFWDSSAYLALAETMRDHNRFAMPQPGGVSPIYELGFGLLKYRFMTAALFGVMADDAQQGAGYVLILYVFVFACSAAVFAIVVLERSEVRVAYVVSATLAGSIITMLQAYNYDQLLSTALLPLTASIAFCLRWGNWAWAAAFSVLCAAHVLIYPEISVVYLSAPTGILVWRLWNESPAVSAVLLSGAACIIILAAIVAPLAPGLWGMFLNAWKGGILDEVRPGENYFPTFYAAECAAGAFWAMYSPFYICGKGHLAGFVREGLGVWPSIANYFAMALGPLLSVAALVGVAKSAGRSVGIVWCIIPSLLLAGWLLVGRHYEYGAYKALAVASPFMIALAVAGIASLPARVAVTLSVVFAVLLVGLTGVRIRILDLMAVYKTTDEFKGVTHLIPVGAPAALKIENYLSYQWAAYYLRDHPLLTVKGGLIYLQKPRMTPVVEAANYLISDVEVPACWGRPIWQSSAYALYVAKSRACSAF